MKNKIIIASWLCLFMGMGAVNAQENLEEGKSIFTTRCASCHSIGKRLTGPALGGISERRSEDWIIQFVKSSSSLIAKGDKDAVAIYNDFNKLVMPDHPDLTEDNIRNVVAYIKSKEAEELNKESGPIAKPSKKQTPYRPLSLKKDYGLFIAYFAAVIVMIFALLTAVNMKRKVDSSTE